MTMMKHEVDILVVEDELLIAEHIVRMLAKSGYESTRIVKSVPLALAAIDDKRPDIVLTDIALSDKLTGIDLGQQLNAEYQIPFIYITSHTDKGLLQQASATKPSAYLVKPFKQDDLMVAIELTLLKAPSKETEDRTLHLKEGQSTHLIPLDEIQYLKAEENYTAIHLVGQRPKLVRQYISQLQESLPESDFIRIHRSYIVNKKFITSIHSAQISLGEVKLPVGRAYRVDIERFR